MLAATLRTFEADGFVHRVAYPEIPPRVEYTLTELGVEVAARVRDLAELLESAAPRIAAAREAYSKA